MGAGCGSHHPPVDTASMPGIGWRYEQHPSREAVCGACMTVVADGEERDVCNDCAHYYEAEVEA